MHSIHQFWPLRYFLFPNMKTRLIYKITSNEMIFPEANAYLENLAKTYFPSGLKKLEKLWTKCIDLKGNYTERWKWINPIYCVYIYCKYLLIYSRKNDYPNTVVRLAVMQPDINWLAKNDSLIQCKMYLRLKRSRGQWIVKITTCIILNIWSHTSAN